MVLPSVHFKIERNSALNSCVSGPVISGKEAVELTSVLLAGHVMFGRKDVDLYSHKDISNCSYLDMWRC